MDYDEFRNRLQEARARAELQRLEAVEILATNEDLRRENGETFGLCSRQLPDHRRIGAQRNSIQPTHEER